MGVQKVKCKAERCFHDHFFHNCLDFFFKPNLILMLASISFFLPFSVSAPSAKMISPDFSSV